jgi:type II secretory pathway pseudopilin PulG
MGKSRPRRHPHALVQGGFSLVEGLISALLLLVSTVAILGVFNYSLQSLRRSSNRDDLSAAISADVAAIELMNDNYACDITTGLCNSINSEQAGPTKYTYAPGSADSGWLTFKQLCDTPTTSTTPGLSTALIAEINQTATIFASSNGQSLSIPRSAKPHPDNNKPDTLPNSSQAIYPRHQYLVEWIPPQGSKRLLLLTPTVANWCP